MINLFSVPLILLYSILFGIFMKIADFHNEHRLKLFKGGAIFFGVFFGIFGSLIILSNNVLANAILALIIASLARGLIDYPNHGIAGTIMLITFFLKSTL